MGVKEVVYDFLFKLDISSQGLFDDWYLALILLALFSLLFGHTFAKHLERKHFFAYIIGFIFAIPPTVMIFFLFHFLELYTGVRSPILYNMIFAVFILIAMMRLYRHVKDGKGISK